MKAYELRELSVDELKEKMNDAREELMRFRFQQATGELTDFNQIRATRRLVARIMTILNEMEAKKALEGEA